MESWGGGGGGEWEWLFRLSVDRGGCDPRCVDCYGNCNWCQHLG